MMLLIFQELFGLNDIFCPVSFPRTVLDNEIFFCNNNWLTNNCESYRLQTHTHPLSWKNPINQLRMKSIPSYYNLIARITYTVDWWMDFDAFTDAGRAQWQVCTGNRLPVQWQRQRTDTVARFRKSNFRFFQIDFKKIIFFSRKSCKMNLKKKW